MAERTNSSSKVETKIARLRLLHGVTQKELADATGLSVRSIQELERGIRGNPPIGNLVNVAAALGVKLTDVCEDEWLRPVKRSAHQRKNQEEAVEKLRKRPGRFWVEPEE